MVGCCAPGCSRRTEHGVRFFGYPKDPKRRKHWEIMTNRPHWTPTEHSKLCQHHFEDDMFKRKEPNWRLKPNAIPTVFLHNQFPMEEMLNDESFCIPTANDVDKIEPLPPEPTPELAAHDHSYISLKKKSPGGTKTNNSSLPPPPVGQEVEIPSEVQGRLVANFEDYQIIQTAEPSDFMSSEADVFTIDENSQVIHHMLPDDEPDHFEESEVIATVELNGMEPQTVVNAEGRATIIEGPAVVFDEDEQEDEEYEEEEISPRMGAATLSRNHEESPPHFVEEGTTVECGPTVNVKTCDDLCFRLRVTVSSLKTALAKATKERDNYKNKLRKEKRKTKGLEKQLMNQSVIPSFLQDDQLKYLQKGSHRGFAWSEETIKQANELKIACGTRGYIALLMHNFPLPGLSTLRSNKKKENEGETSNSLTLGTTTTEEIEVHVP